MSLARHVRFLCKSAALSASMAVMVLCLALGALGLLVAAFIIWLSHLLGMAAAVAIAGAVLLVMAFIVMGVARLALVRMQANQPSLAAEALGMFGFGLRMATLIIRRDPSKALLTAMIAGALAEYLSGKRPPGD